MEGGCVHVTAHRLAQHGAQSFFQFPRRLVGEGDGQHIPGARRTHRQIGSFPGKVPSRLDGLPQFFQILFGHGTGQLLAAVCAAETDDVGDPVDQHRGLAGTGAGQNQQRAFGGEDGLPLNRVQAGEFAFNILVAQGDILLGKLRHDLFSLLCIESISRPQRGRGYSAASFSTPWG